MFSAEQGRQLGFGSARMAMFDALVTIGGPEAVGVLHEALETTASPREIALLARNLEALAPEQYRGQAVEAARQSLAMAVEKQLEGFDVAPLFEVMERYGGADVVADLERSTSKWNYYATLALGNLPNGAGVPALIRMADRGLGSRASAGRWQALQVLTQLAASNEAARAALVEQVRGNHMSTHLWPYLSRPLAGDQAYLQNSVLGESETVPAEARTGATSVVRGMPIRLLNKGVECGTLIIRVTLCPPKLSS